MFRRGFWRCNPKGEPTRGRKGFDLAFGILLPILCLYLDPVVFTRNAIGDSSDERGLLVAYQAMAYAEIGFQVALLGAWMLFSKRLAMASGIFAGAFVVGAVFSLLVGCRLLPISIGVLMVGMFPLTFLGLTPFLSTLVYARNCFRAHQIAKSRFGGPLLNASLIVGAGSAVAAPLLLEETIQERILAAEQRRMQAYFERLPAPSPVAFLREDESTLLAVGGADGTVQFWDIDTKRVVREIPRALRSVRCLSAAADGETIAIAGPKPGVLILEARSGALYKHATGPLTPVSAFALSPDGALLASANHDEGAVLWDAATGGRLRSIPSDGLETTALAFSPDGRILACGMGKIDAEDVRGEIRCIEAATGAVVRTIEEPMRGLPTSLAFTPDGRNLGIAAWRSWRGRGGFPWSSTEVSILDLEKAERRFQEVGLECYRAFRRESQGYSVAFSPDGKTLAVGTPGGCACLGAWEEKGDFALLGDERN